MFERLDQIEARYEELNAALASPEITSDSVRYQKTAKAHSEIAPIAELYREYKDLKRGIAESKAMLADEKDPEMRAYALEELNKLEARVTGVEEELKVLLLPKDPNDEKDVILEIRAGTGGDEATLFAAEMFACIPATLRPRVGRSQIKNREKGMRVLRSRLYEIEMQKQQDALAKERKAMVGSGDRSEKIRTYNFPQNRVTDHRIGLTIHQLQEVMDGKLQPLIDALVTHFQAERLKQETAGVA